MSSPTATQRGDGRPQISVKLYFDNDLPGAAERAMIQVQADYERLLR